uniref:Uncharacterized protein n=1 Tax=Plectus sambesii TaxID=2011161 RepID=A0A914XN14_9BILA
MGARLSSESSERDCVTAAACHHTPRGSPTRSGGQQYFGKRVALGGYSLMALSVNAGRMSALWWKVVVLVLVLAMLTTSVQSAPRLSIEQVLGRVSDELRLAKRDGCGCDMGCFFSSAHECMTCCAQGLK